MLAVICSIFYFLVLNAVDSVRLELQRQRKLQIEF